MDQVCVDVEASLPVDNIINLTGNVFLFSQVTLQENFYHTEGKDEGLIEI